MTAAQRKKNKCALTHAHTMNIIEFIEFFCADNKTICILESGAVSDPREDIHILNTKLGINLSRMIIDDLLVAVVIFGVFLSLVRHIYTAQISTLLEFY